MESLHEFSRAVGTDDYDVDKQKAEVLRVIRKRDILVKAHKGTYDEYQKLVETYITDDDSKGFYDRYKLIIDLIQREIEYYNEYTDNLVENLKDHKVFESRTRLGKQINDLSFYLQERQKPIHPILTPEQSIRNLKTNKKYQLLQKMNEFINDAQESRMYP